MKLSYRYALVAALLIAAVIFKSPDSPSQPPVDDIKPILNNLRCAEVNTSSEAYQSGVGKLDLHTALASVRPGDYTIQFQAYFHQLSNDSIGTESNLDQDKQLLRLSVINPNRPDRLISEVAPSNNVYVPYTAQMGDEDLRLEIIDTKGQVNPDGKIFVKDFQLIAEVLPSVNPAASNTYRSSLLTSPELGRAIDLGGTSVALPFTATESQRVAQFGVVIKSVGSGGLGNYYASIAKPDGTILALTQFDATALSAMRNALGSVGIGNDSAYLPLPVDLENGQQYFLILSGRNVSTNRGNTETLIGRRSNAIVSTGLTKSFGVLKATNARIEAIVPAQHWAPVTRRLASATSGIIRYQSSRTYLDYFDPKLVGGGSKSFDQANRVITADPQSSLIYDLTYPDVKISALKIVLRGGCQNVAATTVEYSVDQKNWVEILHYDGSDVEGKAEFGSSAHVFVRFRAESEGEINPIAIPDLQLTGIITHG